MSKIPEGLYAGQMRARMEDKGSFVTTENVNSIGGLYVGSTTPIQYVDENNQTINAYETMILLPTVNDAGLPLCSNGSGELISYRTIGTNGISDDSILPSNLGKGTVISSFANQKMALGITGTQVANKSDNIVISFATYEEPQAVGYSVTITHSGPYHMNVYDGIDSNGTLLIDLDSSVNGAVTVTCTTGKLFFEEGMENITSITGSNGATSTNPSTITADGAAISVTCSGNHG